MIDTKTERMRSSDYIVVCIRQMLTTAGSNRALPNDFLDLFEMPVQEEYAVAINFAEELFGEYPSAETGELLFKVDRLTLKESAIAARTDLTHSEKIGLIRPLRQAREAAINARWECQVKKYDAADEPKEIISREFDQHVCDSDAIRARGLGIVLD